MQGIIRRNLIAVAAALDAARRRPRVIGVGRGAGAAEGEGDLGDRLVVDEDRDRLLSRRQAGHRRRRRARLGPPAPHPRRRPHEHAAGPPADRARQLPGRLRTRTRAGPPTPGGRTRTRSARTRSPACTPSSTGGTFGSTPSQTPQAHCNAGERVLGTGGYIQDTGGQVGIQVVARVDDRHVLVLPGRTRTRTATPATGACSPTRSALPRRPATRSRRPPRRRALRGREGG